MNKKAEEEKVRAAKRARYAELDRQKSSNSETTSNPTTSVSDSSAEITTLKEEAEALIPEIIKKDEGANMTGLYELIGVVTHQGASADAGHYQCFAKQLDAAPYSGLPSKNGQKEENTWWRFNDDKVTDVPQSRIESLAGGGEADSALILLYRAVAF